VIIPTRRRREYLAVALASVAAQVREHGAELLVVEDDPADPETARLAEAAGARYLAHGAPRGLNAARNTAARAAGADLLCFLDDDVEAWPGWLGALLAGAAAAPDHLVLGGPIRARLEGTDLHPCGREPLPVTVLDLGQADRDADFVWGANLALRRGALTLAGGGFDETLDLYGDEEDLQRRLRAAGGRVRYVAAAGVDHRRAGADARIGGLSRAAWHRGRNSRRYDVRKGVAPSAASELRTLAGCAAHVVRYRCGNGIVLSAHTAGRLRELVAARGEAGAAAAVDTPDPPYLSGESGTLGRRGRARGAVLDRLADVLTAPDRLRLRRAARFAPPRRRVLAVSVARPEHAGMTAATAAELRRSRHDVRLHFTAPAPGAGKWANLNAALEAAPADGEDWLLIVDDDVLLPRGFLDVFLHVCERHDLVLAQPAHAFDSHAAWRVTRRRPGAVARRTAFVEIGPVTAIRADAFGELLPFPVLHMGWGLDAHWSAVAAARGWRMGVVDAVPVRHTRPVAADYPRDRAVAEAEAFLAERPYVTRDVAQRTLETWR
jgi:GT2 family glycosyltransferase